MRYGAVVLIFVAATLTFATTATAHWSSKAGTGGGVAHATELTAPVLSVPNTSGFNPSISFSSDAKLTARPAAGAITYVVQRKVGSGAFAEIASGGCSGALTKPATNCSDTVSANGSYTYRAVAHLGSWTATSVPVTVSAADAVPTVMSVGTLDPSPTNATALHWRVRLSEPVTGLDPTDFTLSRTGVDGSPAVTSVSGSGTDYIVTASGGSGSGTVALNLVDNDTILDNVRQPLGGSGTTNGSFAGPAYTIDRGPPGVTKVEMLDANANGYVDRVAVTFDDALAPSTATGNWSLVNAPSGATLASVSTSGRVATLVLTEGTGAADTAVGTFTVALSADSTGIRDGLGNQASFAAQAPLDRAGPVLLPGITDTNGLTDGQLESLDTLSLPFSEPIASGSLLGVSTLAESRVSAAHVFLTAPSVLASTDLGTSSYLTSAGTYSCTSTNSVVGSTVVLSATLCPPLTGLPTAPALAATAVFVPASALTDTAGNPAAGSQSLTTKLF